MPFLFLHPLLFLHQRELFSEHCHRDRVRKPQTGGNLKRGGETSASGCRHRGESDGRSGAEPDCRGFFLFFYIAAVQDNIRTAFSDLGLDVFQGIFDTTLPSLLLLYARVIFYCRRSSSVSSRTWFNTPCVTATDSKINNNKILRIGPNSQPFNPTFYFSLFSLFEIRSYLGEEESGEKAGPFTFFSPTRRPNVEKPKRTRCAIIPEDAPDRRPARLPSTEKKGEKILAVELRGEDGGKKRKGKRAKLINFARQGL